MYLGRPAARGPVVFQAGLAEADERAQAADEAHPFRQVLEEVDDPPVHQAEVAAVERNVEVADRVQGAVEG